MNCPDCKHAPMEEQISDRDDQMLELIFICPQCKAVWFGTIYKSVCDNKSIGSQTHLEHTAQSITEDYEIGKEVGKTDLD